MEDLFKESYSALKGTTIGVTGAAGFIGSRILEILFEKVKPISLKGLDQNKNSSFFIQKLGATPYIGDVNDESLVRQFCSGCDIIIHCAAVVKDDGDMKFFRKINVEGSSTVARISEEVGVKTFVILSSVMVYGFTYPKYVDEDGPKRGENNPYCQTKIECEQAVKAICKKTKLIIIRPGDVYGPKSPPWVIQFLKLMKKTNLMLLPNYGSGCMNHCYIDNLVDGIVLTIHKGQHGEAYNVTDGANTTWYEYSSQLSQAGFGHSRVYGVPKLIFLILLYVLLFLEYIKIILCLSKESPNFSTTSMKFMCRPYPYSIKKISALGYKPQVPLKTGMENIKKWVKIEKPI